MPRPTLLILTAFVLFATTALVAGTTAVVAAAEHESSAAAQAPIDDERIVVASALTASAGKLVSKSVRPNVGYTKSFLTVPPGKLFMLTQACIEHPGAMIRVRKGPTFRKDGRLTYGARGCTTYTPAYAISPGETLACTNNSGLTRTCSVMGQMIENPDKRRGVLIDVDAVLEAQAAAEKQSEGSGE